jgi:hypothetical protein
MARQVLPAGPLLLFVELIAKSGDWSLVALPVRFAAALGGQGAWGSPAARSALQWLGFTIDTCSSTESEFHKSVCFGYTSNNDMQQS